MTNEEIHNKVIDTNLAVVRIEGDIKVLTATIGSYVSASHMAELHLDQRINDVDEKIKTIDKRIWGSLISGIGGLLAALWTAVKG